MVHSFLFCNEKALVFPLLFLAFIPTHISHPLVRQRWQFFSPASVPPAGFVITNNIPTLLLLITAAKWVPLVGLTFLLCFHLGGTLTPSAQFLDISHHPVFEWLNSSRLMGSLEAEPGWFFSGSLKLYLQLWQCCRVCWTVSWVSNYLPIFALFLEIFFFFFKHTGRDQIANICWLDHRKSKRVPEKHLFLLYWLCQSLWLCGSQ